MAAISMASIFAVTGLEDVSQFPNLLKELARRSWSDADLRKVAGENFLRVLDAADAVARTTDSSAGTVRARH
ncbi:MAG: membrane dipeptidase [Dokdonella sp.]